METPYPIFKNTKKIKIILGIGVILVLVLIFSANIQKPKTITYNLEDKTYHLLTAHTTLEKIQGLSNIHQAKGFDGMIFYFDPPEQVTFWNKDTYLDLKLVWLNHGQVLGYDDLPSIKNGLITKPSPGAITEVVELIK